jgi:hypothetical protein
MALVCAAEGCDEPTYSLSLCRRHLEESVAQALTGDDLGLRVLYLEAYPGVLRGQR